MTKARIFLYINIKEVFLFLRPAGFHFQLPVWILGGVDVVVANNYMGSPFP
jgi:hypothetical protein